MSTIGQRIKEIRQELRLSQNSLDRFSVQENLILVQLKTTKAN